ncbi:hypothetical protein LOD99_14402 [Oopsacas minuta]|uniref:DUF7932 domain-containing protein n=1 Tax=Oopsacas minuta TaxID=111878 RepID=A0AAV7KG54_9METZ|nr:hypothetical protein LOD99_14402 [Oopsacas minuta]
MARAQPGELSPHLIHPAKFEVKYETRVGLFNKFVYSTIEILCNEDETLLSIVTNVKSKKKQNDQITFSLNSYPREIFLFPYLFTSNDLSTLSKFRISGSMNMGPLQCESIVQLHRLLASLKDEGNNLFNKEDRQVSNKNNTHATWQVITLEIPYDHKETLKRVSQTRDDSTPIKRRKSHPSTPPPTYIEAVKRFPMAYYRPEDINTYLTAPIPTAPPLPRNVETPLIKSTHDVFLPPYGNPMSYPISLGYGIEVGLNDDVQELFDPTDNSLFYLNHKTNKFYIDDPRILDNKSNSPLPYQILRPRDMPPVINISSLSFDDVAPTYCQVERMATLALQRWTSYSGYEIHLCGRCGEHGIHGISSPMGFYGCRGADGRFYGGPGHQGQEGKFGSHGTDGLSGSDGTPGRNFYFNLSGNSDRLLLSGGIMEQLDIGKGSTQSILYINASGGKGGRGGKGGDGGNGGMGGMGGHGHKGMVGIDAMIPGGAGGAGQSGGFGGRGGNGGDGGNGGSGGSGGRGGDGGRVIISSTNPALFALVEVNSLGGKGGRGGKGGKGGERGEGGKGGGGGDAGRGGMGGPGTDDSTAGFHGTSGKVGLVGQSGKPGSWGRRGSEGTRGENGSPGGVRWVVLGDRGEVIFSTSTKFNIEVLSDGISLNSAVDDDIFEPSERISVNGIKIYNSGELSLPAGAKFRMISSDTINFEDVFVTLPEIEPGMKYAVTEILHGRIFDIPPPNSRKPFLSIASFKTQVDLYNRSITDPVPPKTIKVQYPIIIKKVTYPVMQNRGTSSHLKITIENISGKHYGYSLNSGGYLSLVIHLDKRLMPIGYNGNIDNKEYHIYYNHEVPDSLTIVVKDLLPKSSFIIDIILLLVNDTDIYDKCLWQVDLLLRQKLIQYKSGYVDVTPGKMTKLEVAPNDVLLVVSLCLLTKQELCFWESILIGLGLNINYWDMSRYKNLEAQTQDDVIDPPTNWSEIFRGQLVIFPHADLKRISIQEVISFFHGSEWKTGNRRNYDSGMFFLMNPDSENTSSSRVKLIQTLCMVNILPDDDNTLTEKQALYKIKTIRPESKLHPLCVINPTSVLWERKCTIVKFIFTCNNVTFSRPSNGEERNIHVVEFPLARNVNFFMFDTILPRKENFKYDNPYIQPDFNSVPFGSNLGQTILCVISALPTAMKINTLMTVLSNRLPCASWRLVTPSGFTLNTLDLIYMTLVKDFTKEMTLSQNEYSRFEVFREKISSMPGQFTEPSTARYTIAIINRLQVVAKNILKNRPVAKFYFQKNCVQMENSLREAMNHVTLMGLATEAERIAALDLDIFLDNNLIFSPYRMDPLCGYVTT